ncbi:MliC family protein [Methylobacterium dankookense]|uniref:C-type lysozyme inhibitor domain-containing protein n=1 Tax=Methylobacterium dankookense TaxID=560405 RepID=A0A564FZQ8_9HYPH|nr:MliC family protein [Methylobacterium dankookense]GJD58499.1 hypothetical protein IFDJLNFL_4420 [Methylobacterium dankookense]VUF13180.1 hypothetical protein MTDSW087_02879 [Methylobacterium dankookense]
MTKHGSKHGSCGAFGAALAPICGCLPLLLALPAHAASPTSRHVTFACPAGLTLSVEFVAADPQASAIVRPSTGPAVTLPSLPSGDGFRYGDASHELRGRGRAVTWSEGSNPAVTCTAPRSSP